MTARVVTIDCFPSSLARYDETWAVVAVDVIRATTTAVTAAVRGRQVHPVRDLDRAVEVARLLDDPLLAGELGGVVPYGFGANNSPAAFDAEPDDARPVVLLSSSGTQLLDSGRPYEAVYAACLRNLSAVVAVVAERHERVAVVGAGTRGEFREEDQLCCAWVAEGLVAAGHEPLDWTASIVDRWRCADVAEVASGHSAQYLLTSGQPHDLRFVLEHVDDVAAAYRVESGVLVADPAPALPEVSPREL